MAAKPIDPSIAERVIADWRTGEYSQRKLADKYSLSTGKVAQLTKDVEKHCERIVSAGVEYFSGLQQQDERNVSAIKEVVETKVRLLGLLDDFQQKAVKKATDMLDKIDNANEFKALADGVDRVSITAGVNERHAKPTTIQNNQQNNYASLTDDDLVRELKQVRDTNATLI